MAFQPSASKYMLPNCVPFMNNKTRKAWLIFVSQLISKTLFLSCRSQKPFVVTLWISWWTLLFSQKGECIGSSEKYLSQGCEGISPSKYTSYESMHYSMELYSVRFSFICIKPASSMLGSFSEETAFFPYTTAWLWKLIDSMVSTSYSWRLSDLCLTNKLIPLRAKCPRAVGQKVGK